MKAKIILLSILKAIKIVFPFVFALCMLVAYIYLLLWLGHINPIYAILLFIVTIIGFVALYHYEDILEHEHNPLCEKEGHKYKNYKVEITQQSFEPGQVAQECEAEISMCRVCKKREREPFNVKYIHYITKLTLDRDKRSEYDKHGYIINKYL